ncbi:GAF domain-containing protein [Methylobacterium sp. J-076]|uniref:GAF domain-containing protein n=1 Tax=Methylobacterium sp. J-076 TaxID=2836655 RepID=UPI001FB9EC94|nr:GAF domain-containing protein [Methylobacterium sp. J-076]MCJ2015617.1 GAF domain-containing protein [Methylobacterium sp. J-076]
MVHREPFWMLVTTEYEDSHDANLADAAARLAAAGTIADVVAILGDTAREIVGSDGIAVVLREGECCHYVAEDAVEPLWRGARFPMSECVSGWAMLNCRAVVIPDIESDPRVPQIAYSRTSMRSLAMVPLGFPEAVAALGAYWCAYIDLNDDIVARLERLAAAATAALNRVSHPQHEPLSR